MNDVKAFVPLLHFVLDNQLTIEKTGGSYFIQAPRTISGVDTGRTYPTWDAAAESLVGVYFKQYAPTKIAG